MSTIFTIFFLILLNAFFSLSEMAIVASKKSILKEMVKKGNKSAQLVLEIIENQGKFLSTIQVGITAVGILAAAYGGATIAHEFAFLLNKIPTLQPYGETIALTIVVTILTYVSVVIGELIPKRIALHDPEKISLFIARPMIVFSKIFSPIISLFHLSAEVVMKFFGVFGVSQNSDAEAEVKAIINEGVETGAIEKSEHEMMHRIFRLDDRDAKSIMTHVSDITFLKIDDDTSEIKRKLAEARHSRYPVIQGDSQKVIGIIQTKELLSDFITNGEADIQSHLQEAHFIPENISCLKVLEMFKASSVTLAIVIDEYGATEGIVTASDIFEAVVGILPANYDENDEVMIIKRDEDSWFVDGITPIEEINLTIGIEEINDEGKFDTTAGFFINNINKNPIEGLRFEKYGYSFEIVDMDGIRIDKILITKLNNDLEEGDEL